MRIYLILGFVLAASMMSAQTSHKLLRTGDAAYNDGEYEKAEINYRKSLEEQRSLNGNFNLGNAIYRQERYEEAVQFYESAANDSNNDDIKKSQSFFNLGNTHLRMDEFEEAVDAFKYAVTLNPEDLDIRKNLYIAKLMYLKEQEKEEQQQQQEQQENQDENQEQEENQEEQENQDQQEQEGEEQKDEEGEEGEPKDEEGKDSEPKEGDESEGEPTQELSKEDAQKLLQVIENEEQKVQEKLRKVSGSKKKPTKDW